MFRQLKAVTIAFSLLVPVATGCAAQKAGIKSLGYAIQVGAFSDVRNAERLTAKLQQKGIEAFYFKRENGIYAVRFGDFDNKDLASRTARKLKAEHVISSYFIASPKPEGRRMEPVIEKAPSASIKKAPSERQAKAEPRKEREPREQEHRRREAEVKKDRSDMGYIAARTAERFVGIPYRWGGDTVVDGMDCSGFVRAVYNLCGVNIPRTSREQFLVGDPVGRDELKDGDLVFFGASENEITHVGIFVGGGRFVHAPKRGDDIKVSTIDEGYYQKRFVGAKRYF